jgi:hypothetical protein
MNQEVIKGIKVPFFNETSNDYGHIRAFISIKQRLRAHERLSMNQGLIKGTKVPFNESSNDYGHMRDVQCIKQWLRAHERLRLYQVITTGT